MTCMKSYTVHKCAPHVSHYQYPYILPALSNLTKEQERERRTYISHSVQRSTGQPIAGDRHYQSRPGYRGHVAYQLRLSYVDCLNPHLALGTEARR
jgi:hypothetical protein